MTIMAIVIAASSIGSFCQVPEGVDALVAKFEPAYAAVAASESFVVHRPQHEHEFTPAIFESLAAWLSEVLVTAAPAARDRRQLGSDQSVRPRL
eukprot:SAG22_NODE_5263_length_1050_cov_1.890641_1_plen_94_part_00